MFRLLQLAPVYFWNPLISMQKIGPKENKWNSNISLNGKTNWKN